MQGVALALTGLSREFLEKRAALALAFNIFYNKMSKSQTKRYCTEI